MAVEAAEDVVYGAVVRDLSEVGEVGATLILASALGCWPALFGCWIALFEAPVVISALPRCSAEARCSLGKFRKYCRGISMVQRADP